MARAHHARLVLLAAVFGVGLVFGCSDGAEPTLETYGDGAAEDYGCILGDLGCECAAGNECDGVLECVSGMCECNVPECMGPPPTTGNETSGGDGDGDGDTTGDGDGDTTGDGDGDTTTGDGDGDTTTGDGDGDMTTGDGDGDMTTGDGDGDMTSGDGDGDMTTGDGDGDMTTGDGDGDMTTGDGDGDGMP